MEIHPIEIHPIEIHPIEIHPIEIHPIEIHPACLKDNEEYIIEKKYNEDNILVYKGIRKVTSLDMINPEGLYEKLHFVNVELLSKKQNMDNMPKIDPPELKRSTKITPEYSDIVQQLGSSFDMDDNLKFYDKHSAIVENEM
jgi:hypothetical protein